MLAPKERPVREKTQKKRANLAPYRTKTQWSTKMFISKRLKNVRNMTRHKSTKPNKMNKFPTSGLTTSVSGFRSNRKYSYISETVTNINLQTFLDTL